ncbi:MAG: VWA domain-containing protein [Planctomycetota bacterium]|nr:VWA domain-containing protein [Planctomycetota bacterium]
MRLSLVLFVLLVLVFSWSHLPAETSEDRIEKFEKTYDYTLKSKEDAIRGLKPINTVDALRCIVKVYEDDPEEPSRCFFNVWDAADKALRDVKEEKVIDVMNSLVFYRKHWRVRARMIRALGEIGHVSSQKSLLKAAAREKEEKALFEIPDAIKGYESNEIYEALYDLAEERKKPRVAVKAVHALAAKAGDVAVKKLHLLLSKDKGHSLALSEALLALSDRKTENLQEHLKAAFDGRDDALHVAACLVLAQKGYEGFNEIVVELLGDRDWQVKAAAAKAAGVLKIPEAVEIMVTDWKRNGDGRLGLAYHKSLMKITGKSFGPRWQFWYRWFKGLEEDFTEAAENEGEYVSYYSMKIVSKNICFVFDTSKSSGYKTKGLDKYVGEGAVVKGDRRIDVIKAELIRCIKNLDIRTRFNLVAFDHNVHFWKERQAQAIPPNKKDAIEWLEKCSTGGWTNIYDSLTLATGRWYDPRTAKLDLDAGPDTVVVLSDGSASVGTHVSDSSVVENLLSYNRLRQVIFHALGLDDSAEDTLKPIAERSGGMFKLLLK